MRSDARIDVWDATVSGSPIPSSVRPAITEPIAVGAVGKVLPEEFHGLCRDVPGQSIGQQSSNVASELPGGRVKTSTR